MTNSRGLTDPPRTSSCSVVLFPLDSGIRFQVDSAPKFRSHDAARKAVTSMASSAKRSASGSRKQLNPRIDKMIAAYATAASAVGVALLATAPTAEAEIIYTKARVTIGRGVTSHYHLDLNHDRIGDFSIGFCSCEPHGTALSISSMRGVGNMVMAAASHPYSAAALKAGAPIGPKQAFQLLEIRMATTGSYFYGRYSGGPWAGGVFDRYLGLKFEINGEFHYGWARMTVGKALQPHSSYRICVRDHPEQTSEGWPDFRNARRGRSRESNLVVSSGTRTKLRHAGAWGRRLTNLVQERRRS